MKAKKFTKETINQMAVNSLKFPEFKSGDAIIVSSRIKEGDKERLQQFQGDVISINKNGVSSTFTVRKIGANSVAVERIFPYHSPLIDSIKLVRKGKVRRAKLYYIRERVGKAGRIKEVIMSKSDKQEMAAANEQ